MTSLRVIKPGAGSGSESDRRAMPSPSPAAAHGLVIAIVGAESTGKTQLAQGLASRLQQTTGLRCIWVPEVLREWCAREGRTPRADEQRGIAQAQQQRIEAAAAEHDIVVADTTPLMIAVYSQLLFADISLMPQAVAAHRGYALTLVTALDLPWVADGHQRDGPHVQGPVDALVRQSLLQHGLAWSVVGGTGPARLEAAVDAATPMLLQLAMPRGGLFTRLQQRAAAQPAWQWVCEKCDVPECEHQALQQARRQALRQEPQPARSGAPPTDSATGEKGPARDPGPDLLDGGR
jgi:nicotinamide riboside kinase